MTISKGRSVLEKSFRAADDQGSASTSIEDDEGGSGESGIGG